MNGKWRLVIVVGICVLACWGIRLLAEDRTAPLNGTVSFQAASAPSDTLNVNAGSETVKATDAYKIQGAANSYISVITAEGSGTVHVADVVSRDGDSLYHVTGTSNSGGGEGGGGGGWSAEYNRGAARVLLELNSYSDDDDLIGLDVQWTSLEVKLVEGADNTTYHVTDISASGTGQVEVPTTPITLTKSDPKMVIYIKGLQEGYVTIGGTCDNDANVVETGGTVVKPITFPSGDPSAASGINGANASNEIVFIDGIACMACEATRILKNPNQLQWTTTNAGTTVAKWSPNTGSDTIGQGLNPTATYTGLPANNDDFGPKTITLRAPDLDQEELTRVIELFYSKTAKDHPGTHTDWPNWMYYWLQTVTPLGPPNTITWVYDPELLTGIAKGSTTITFSDLPAGEISVPYGAHNPLRGIDAFAYAVMHESQHYQDWIDFWQNDITTWMNARYSFDENGDRDCDQIPNKYEDTNHNLHYDIPDPNVPSSGDPYDFDSCNTPGHPEGVDNDFEDRAYKLHPNVTGNHSKDWACPGYQHGDLDDYND